MASPQRLATRARDTAVTHSVSGNQVILRITRVRRVIRVSISHAMRERERERERELMKFIEFIYI